MVVHDRETIIPTAKASKSVEEEKRSIRIKLNESLYSHIWAMAVQAATQFKLTNHNG